MTHRLMGARALKRIIGSLPWIVAAACAEPPTPSAPRTARIP